MQEWEEKKSRYSNLNFSHYRYNQQNGGGANLQQNNMNEIEQDSPPRFEEDEGQQQPVRMLLKKDNMNGGNSKHFGASLHGKSSSVNSA